MQADARMQAREIKANQGFRLRRRLAMMDDRCALATELHPIADKRHLLAVGIARLDGGR